MAQCSRVYGPVFGCSENGRVYRWAVWARGILEVNENGGRAVERKGCK